MLPLLIFTFLFYKNLGSNYIVFMAIVILCLPIHELCHALFCWITGRKVERIFFFPYKDVFSTPAAYVKPVFGVWNQTQVVLWSLFPLLLLSVAPALVSVFIPSLRMGLTFLSLLNLSVSNFDVIDILCFLKLPRNCLHFGSFILMAKEADKPIIIHQLSVTPEPNRIDHTVKQTCLLPSPIYLEYGGRCGKYNLEYIEWFARCGVIPYVPALEDAVREIARSIDENGICNMPVLEDTLKNIGIYGGQQLEVDWRTPTKKLCDITFRALLILYYAKSDHVKII